MGSLTQESRLGAVSSSEMRSHRQLLPSMVERYYYRLQFDLWEQVCLKTAMNEILTSFTNMMGKIVSLMYLVLLQGEKEREGVGSGGTSGSTCGQNWDRVWQQQIGSECNEVQLTGSLRPSSGWYWAELSCRHGWEHLWSEKKKKRETFFKK